MEATILGMTDGQASLSIKGADIGTLYAVQHEMLRGAEKDDFAGVIVKHPLTNEIWMRVSSSKGDPLGRIAAAAESALGATADLRRMLESKIKVN